MGRAVLGIAAWLLLVVGGGSLLARHDASVQWVPELRFAGVDLVYALRRVAAEADRNLLLDEIRPSVYEADLFLVRVDVDLPSGPVEQALDRLKHFTGRFDYRVEPDLIYVRSNATLDKKTEIDAKVLLGGRFKGNMKDLIGWLMAQLPGSYLTADWGVGQPVFASVELDVPTRSSVLDVLLMYSRALNFGWRIQRAGYELEDADVPELNLPTTGTGERSVYLSSNVTLWPRLTRPLKVYPGRNADSLLRAVASISRRVGTPVAAIDRSLLVRNRGNLDMWSGVDGGIDLETALMQLGGRSDQYRFRWEWRDGFVYMHSDLFDFADTGRGILSETVRGGHFEGSLPELARWINERKLGNSGQVLMGGEIVGNERVTSFDIPDGWNVEQVLLEFTRVTGEGFVFVAQEAAVLAASAPDKPETAGGWYGGYLTQLSDWLEPGDFTVAY